MGNAISYLFGKVSRRILVVGLDFAGKTTIFYNLKMSEMKNLVPTIGFGIETVEYQNFAFTLWDVVGGSKNRLLWRHFYEGSKGVIFVIDSQDKDRGELAAQELHELSSELAAYDLPLLIFANKQDCTGAMSLEELTKILHPEDLHQKIWHIQLCSAKTGDGLYEGIEWLKKMQI